MKKMEELYQEILQDEGLKGEFVEAAKDNKIEAFLQKNDCTATPAELQEFAKKKQSELGLLSDAELDAAAGGFNTDEDIISMELGCSMDAICSTIDEGTEWRVGSGMLICDYCDYSE